MSKVPIVSLFCLILLSCEREKPLPPPNPPVDTDLCGRMCTHLNDLKCEEGKDVYNSDLPGPLEIPNQSCKDWCIEMQDKGVFINPRCVATVASCDEIEESRQKDPNKCELKP